MNMQEVRSRLESIIGKPAELVRIENSRWQRLLQAVENMQGRDEETIAAERQGIVAEGATWFPLRAVSASEPERVSEEWLFRIDEDRLEPSVRQLIALLAQSVSVDWTEGIAQKAESGVQQLGYWLAEQLEHGESPQELPDMLVLKSRLFTEMIPFLLICEGAQNTLGGYEELHQLLSTFLEREVLVVPLHDREWLLLVDRLDVLEVSEEREDEESDQELLEAFGLGLYELIASEWTGIFNLSVSEPLQPAHGLVPALRLLRESVYLGKTFHVTRHVHLPWELGVERLVYGIPAVQRERFMEEFEGLDAILADGETLTTLETFFQMNCNVSETAKRLYVHRNTLIYRLDKVKQETGLDVRNFGDAVLMKLAVLLDKVTKD
ncbi:polyketide synthase regulator [Saccharibacillus sp. O23]|uniref:PucR family transcriptional regulator n=1 Tax=Saccharibacillus sp. O23 TaxID=2009338 RepID=UPI000B4E50E6|nr:helix-turn-helix domain-containing protein [Saccharibacillus sp. O23]OWR28564.1 polyketide synthase regulator [Saccharibacillus sp. O23]